MRDILNEGHEISKRRQQNVIVFVRTAAGEIYSLIVWFVM